MSNLTYRQSKIQEKRKQTPWRDFVMEICSWKCAMLYKRDKYITIFNNTDRVPHIVSVKEFEISRESLIRDDDLSWWDFFLSYRKLLDNINLPATIQFWSNENADFADVIYNSKNAYLSFTVTSDSENILYTFRTGNSIVNCLNSYYVIDNCENIFQSSVVMNSMNIFYARGILNSNNIRFSANMIGCSECLFCQGLENKSYHINNKEYTKDDYLVMKKKMLSQKWDYQKYYKQVLSYRISNIASDNVQWQGIIQSSNIKNGLIVYNASMARNVCIFWSTKYCENLYDVCMSGNADHFYAICDAWGFSEHIYCSSMLATVSFCFYSYMLESCSFCLGCIWLKNKQFCILNKQYSKEDRYEKVDEIFWQMEKDETLWEFFPASMNPFYFNDTAAYLIDPSFTKEEVTAKWYLWRDEPIKVDIVEWAKVVKTSELSSYEWWQHASSWTIVKDAHKEVPLGWLPEWEWDSSTPLSLRSEWRKRHIDSEILNVIIQDESWNVYRIVKMEYDFLMKHWLPLPRTHRLDRMKENFSINS